MTKAAFADLGVPMDTMVTPNMQCYNKALSKYAVPFDVAQAKSVLEKDGYKAGSDGTMSKNGKPLKLKIVMWNTTNQLGDFMQQELQKVGIASTVKNTDINTWIDALFTTKNYDLTVYSYYSAFPNPVIIPAQDASLSIVDPKYFSLSDKAEQAPESSACPAWDTAHDAGPDRLQRQADGRRQERLVRQGLEVRRPVQRVHRPIHDPTDAAVGAWPVGGSPS